MTNAAEDRPLDEATLGALVQLVIRGMQRGPLTPVQQQLVDLDLAMAKGPIVMPTAAGTEAAQRSCRLPADGETRAALW